MTLDERMTELATLANAVALSAHETHRLAANLRAEIAAAQVAARQTSAPDSDT